MANFVVALTGGVASGKSQVERLFAALGVVVIDADRLARELVEPGQEALSEIAARFGSEVLLPDGTLDRRRLREHIFTDEAARKDLEAILHPRIRREMQDRARRADSPYVLLAIPLLVENPASYGWVDRVLVVDSSRTTQLERLLHRDGIDASLAHAMLDVQGSREQRLAIADDVIDNDGPIHALDDSVLALHQRYLAMAASKF